MIFAAFALLALVLAVLVRVLFARHSGTGIPEAVLLDVSTWLIASVLFVAMAGTQMLLTKDDEPEGTTPTTTGTPLAPSPGATTPDPTATPTPTPTPPTPGDTATPPGSGAGSDASCDPGNAFDDPVSGFRLVAASVAETNTAEAELPSAMTIAVRTVQTSGGQAFGHLVAICAGADAATSATGLAQQYETELAKAGEAVTSTSRTVGKVVVQGRRTAQTDDYVGVWPRGTYVYAITDVTSAEVTPFLDAAVPALK